jgi:hypothetical protein
MYKNDGCSCMTDVAFLDSKIRKTPAYKINKKAYNTSYSKIVKEAASIRTIFDCYSILNELLISLNDNHSRVYGVDQGATDEVNEDAEKLYRYCFRFRIRGVPNWRNYIYANTLWQ